MFRWFVGFVTLVCSSTVFELPIWNDVDGSLVVDARALLCPTTPPQSFRMKLRMYDFSTIERSLRNCQIQFPSVSGERDLVFRQTDEFSNAVCGVSIFGIGPRSYASTNFGVDLISGASISSSMMRLGASLDDFLSNACAPNSTLVVPVEPSGVISSALVRFDLLDTVTGVHLNTTFAPEPINLESVRDRFIATLPEHLASRLDDILVQSGAVGSVSDFGIWSYSNCGTEIMETLPLFVVEFYNGTSPVATPALAGTIHLSPHEYMPGCAFAVGEPGLTYSLDILKLPYINKRIVENAIYLCESPVAP